MIKYQVLPKILSPALTQFSHLNTKKSPNSIFWIQNPPVDGGGGGGVKGAHHAC